MVIAGVVVVYYPDTDELVRNIHSYIGFLNQLYIIDNTPEPIHSEEKLRQLPRSQYIKNEKNLGVAKALNIALDQAVQNGYQWLLTMDQDSFFEGNEGKKFFDYFERSFAISHDVAIVCPLHSAKAPQSGDSGSYHPVITAITSGSLLNTGICKKLGGFDENLFIDEIDFEYCYRAIINQYKIFQFDHVHLNHRIGTKRKVGYLYMINSSDRVLHSPQRVYFMVRNHYYVAAKYRKFFPEEFRRRRRDLLVSLKNNLFFSGQFFKVLFSAVKGYLHFKRNKFSVNERL